ncbi:hypothetical protein GBQ70_04690 [Halomicrobium sp. ZPS1]|uniref:Uncharacterized protein n=1 Tax=Halomicrobium mukohataei TaxID=57705 RepID=A0A4D6KDG1_9EURY|nr:hypothetical protein E5139_04695 [Halomicrobium mukohataei]QFR19775.1 hypothetical protein GBQ70_04690 [Halomicrobium sp. ZPS1]
MCPTESKAILKGADVGHTAETSVLPVAVAVSVIVAIESQCTPDRTTAVRSVCESFQLLL